MEESDEDVGRCADVLCRPPGQQEGLSADQSGRTGVGRVVQVGGQSVELRQVDVREPEQGPVSGGQVVCYAPVVGGFQGILDTNQSEKHIIIR